MTTKPRLVIIDDTDPRIKYSVQGWFQDDGSRDSGGSYGPIFHRTQHGTMTNGTHLNFAFQGTGFKFYGTSDDVKDDGDTTHDPIFTCTVDGKATNPTTPPVVRANNQVLCEADSLVDGPHDVVATVTTSGHTLWFDYVLYEPSITTNETTLQNKTLVINNNYPLISYSDGWMLFNNSLHLTQQKDTSMKFDFTGTGITWYSQIPSGFPQETSSGTFSIDAQSGNSFTVPWNSTNQYNWPLFSISNLPTGSHSLVVTYNGDKDHAPLILDYLIVEPNFASSSPTSPSTPPASSSIVSPNSSGSNDPSSKKAPTGAIVGGVLGGLALILALVFLWLRRGKRSSKPRSQLVIDDPDELPEPIITSPAIPDAIITPFTSSGTSSSHPEAKGHDSHRLSLSSALQTSENRTSSQPCTPIISSPVSPVQTGMTPLSKGRQNQPLGRLRLVHHEDSGSRFAQDDSEEVIVDIPPGYTER